jgi:hypothetical protein
MSTTGERTTPLQRLQNSPIIGAESSGPVPAMNMRAAHTECARRLAEVTAEALTIAGASHWPTGAPQAVHVTVRAQLEYKTGWYGSKVRAADQWYPSSKTCSACGKVNTGLTLSDRSWTCLYGVTHDRDQRRPEPPRGHAHHQRLVAPRRLAVPWETRNACGGPVGGTSRGSSRTVNVAPHQGTLVAVTVPWHPGHHPAYPRIVVKTYGNLLSPRIVNGRSIFRVAQRVASAMSVRPDVRCAPMARFLRVAIILGPDLVRTVESSSRQMV